MFAAADLQTGARNGFVLELEGTTMPHSANGSNAIASSSRRSAHTAALLGAETYKKVQRAKVLVVGAGGIGCELRESSGKRPTYGANHGPRPSSQESRPGGIREY